MGVYEQGAQPDKDARAYIRFINTMATSNNSGKPIVLCEHKCTYTNISSTSAALCCLGKDTLQTDAEQINRGSWGKGTQSEGSKALS